MVKLQHHAVIIVGGGPGGLGVAATLEGWHPIFQGNYQFPSKEVQAFAKANENNPLAFDPHALLALGHRPIEFYRMRHHPQQDALPIDQWTLKFQKKTRVDWKMLTTDGPGGLWNNVPKEQMTLGPAHWMELSHYPIGKFYEDTGRKRNLNHLAHRDDLVLYYHAFAKKLGLNEHIKKGVEVTSISPAENNSTANFIVESANHENGISSKYSCNFIVFAIGPRSKIRTLNAEGVNQDYISYAYTSSNDFPKERVLVIGGGRSADWAAQELHDAGRTVIYVMRQKPESHLKLINDSQYLPYYRRWAEIISGDQKRMGLLYESNVTAFKENGIVVISTPEGVVEVEIDHTVVEIGGEPDYQILEKFGELTFHKKHDNFRFQLNQMVVDQATFESVDIPRLYPAGYSAQGTGLSVIGFHTGCFLISGDILRKLGCI